MKRLSQRLLTGCVLAFALTGGYWGMCLTPLNRWAMYFSRLDFWVLLALTLAGGSLLGAGAYAAERLFPRAKPLLVASFWPWLALALANNFPALRLRLVSRTGWTWLTGTVWWLVVWGLGALGMALALVSPRWKNGAARGWFFLRRVCWPAVFVIPLAVWRLPFLDAARGQGLDFSLGSGNGTPATVVLMFDMLGYEELFDEAGQVRTAYTNFARFCETSDVFHAAESAGEETATSLPGFIVQERLASPPRKLVRAFGDWLFQDGTETLRAQQFAAQSLPARARDRGGRAQAIGMYIPWDAILPGVWSATESMAFAYGNQGVHDFGQVPSFRTAAKGHFAWYFLVTSKSPLSAAFKLSGMDERTKAQGYGERRSLVSRAGRLLRESLSPGDFVFVHVDLPHCPYVIGRDGERLPPSLQDDEVLGFAAQTAAADWALGVWLEAIASSPAGREAWVVVTSDHNRQNPVYRKGPVTHVPFLVHRPGQTQRRDVAEPADLTDLAHVVPDLPLFAAGERAE